MLARLSGLRHRVVTSVVLVRGEREAEASSVTEVSLEELSPAFMDHLVASGFDPVYGARPLKRAIQQQLENPLAQRILAGEFEPGQTVIVDLDGENTTFTQR